MNDGGVTPRKEVEKLDVEDEEDRQNRIQSFLENLNSTSGKKPSIFPAFDFGHRTTHAVDPPSELLSRVQAFLPQLEASNSLLAQRAQADPKSVDIEHVEDGMGQYIEMNLGLGVFEDRMHRKSQEDAQMSTSSSSESSDIEEDESDVDSDSSSEIITSFLPARPIRPLPKRKAAAYVRPQIVVLGEGTMSS